MVKMLVKEYVYPLGDTLSVMQAMTPELFFMMGSVSPSLR
jgi:hypothetical protein